MIQRDQRRPALIGSAVLTVLSLLWIEQVSAEVPSWVKKPPRDRDAVVVVGVATARTLEIGQRAALLNAAAQVAEYLGITMEGTGTKVRTELELQLTEELKYSTDRVPLRGALIQEWYFQEASGGYEVFVLVHYPHAELEKTKSRLQAEKAERVTQARMKIRQGEASWKRGHVMEALQAFSEALGASRGADQIILESEARNQIIALLQSLEIAIASGDGQVIEPGGTIRTPLVVQVTSRMEGERYSVEGVPVQFSWGDQPLKTKGFIVTDSDGEAQFGLEHYRAKLSPGTHRIVAELDKEAILARILPAVDAGKPHNISEIGRFELPSVNFLLKVIPVFRTTRIIILVDESNLGQVSSESIVMQTLSESLQQAGFRVVADHEIGRTNIERLQEALRKEQLWPIRPELQQEADLVLTGTASTRKGTDNLGGVISSHADVFIRALDLKTGEVVAQENLMAQTGFGDNLELAGIRALQEAGRIVSKAIVDQLVLAEEAKTNGKP
jgi:hypothetical protein